MTELFIVQIHELLNDLKIELDQRDANGLTRCRRLLQSAQSAHIVVDNQPVLSFCSNDYLGLANHPELIAAMQHGVAEAGVGSGASHLITGHHQYHDNLEKELAAFVGFDDALLFSTGYMANIGVVTSLVGRGDVIFADKLNHASLNDAALISRADLQRYAHNDMVALENLLRKSAEKNAEKSKARRQLIIVDAVFSMDGDIVAVSDLLKLCERYDAYLLVDDAHGFGVLGSNGRGVLSHFSLSAFNASSRIIYMATLGKAAGVSGAFVAANQVIVDTLKQKARTYIYTTASPPALAYALSTSLELIQHGDALRTHLQHLIATLKEALGRVGKWRLMASNTAIQPLLVGSNADAVKLSEYLLTLGILVPAIRPPTVPENTARLRITLTAAHTLQDVEKLVEAINSAQDFALEGYVRQSDVKQSLVNKA